MSPQGSDCQDEMQKKELTTTIKCHLYVLEFICITVAPAEQERLQDLATVLKSELFTALPV